MSGWQLIDAAAVGLAGRVGEGLGAGGREVGGAAAGREVTAREVAGTAACEECTGLADGCVTVAGLTPAATSAEAPSVTADCAEAGLAG